MEILKQAQDNDERVDLAALVEAIPYNKFLGIQVDQKGTEITTILPFIQQNIGNPVLPALHGGVIASLLETTAIIQIVYETKGAVLPKPIDLTIDYMRSGRPQDTYARARITKHGRRVMNVHVEAWQEEHTKLIAAAQGHFLIPALDEQN